MKSKQGPLRDYEEKPATVSIKFNEKKMMEDKAFSIIFESYIQYDQVKLYTGLSFSFIYLLLIQLVMSNT